jgi:hypothetical protein
MGLRLREVPLFLQTTEHAEISDQRQGALFGQRNDIKIGARSRKDKAA